MPGQPFLRICTMAGDIDQLGIVADTVKDKDRADNGSRLDHEFQVAVDQKRLVNAKDDGALTAIVALVQSDGCRQRGAADPSFRLLADQPSAAVAVFPLCRERNYAEYRMPCEVRAWIVVQNARHNIDLFSRQVPLLAVASMARSLSDGGRNRPGFTPGGAWTARMASFSAASARRQTSVL